ncbi:MAG: acyltransferase family protein [Thermodesulfobacteriota bacterium]
MFGTYRFVLALLVASDHMGLFRDFHVGATAVIGFYLLSGFVMNHSFRRNFNLDIRNIFRFYLDRFMRIYPTYLFAVIIIVLFFALTHPNMLVTRPLNVLANVVLVPLNYYMYLGEPNFALLTFGKMAIPVAPSLALEAQFYLLVPLLLFYRRLLYVVFPMSLLVFSLAAFNVIDTYYFGYILLPGVLSIFLMGTMLYNYVHEIDIKANGIYLKASILVLFLILVLLSLTDRIELEHNLEIFTGVFLGFAAIFILSRVGLKSRVDKLLGNLSYPIFLLHWLSIWFFADLLSRYPLRISPRGLVVLQVLFTIVISAGAYYLFDVRMQKWRKRLQLSGVKAARTS